MRPKRWKNETPEEREARRERSRIITYSFPSLFWVDPRFRKMGAGEFAVRCPTVRPLHMLNLSPLRVTLSQKKNGLLFPDRCYSFFDYLARSRSSSSSVLLSVRTRLPEPEETHPDSVDCRMCFQSVEVPAWSAAIR